MRRRYEDIGHEAAAWVIRLGGAPLSLVERSDFDAWLAASADHVDAFARADALWGESAALKDQPGLSRAPAENRITRGRSAQPILAVIALVALLAGGTRAWFGDPTTWLAADDRTALGEIRTVTLTDGSQVQLDTASAIAVDFTARQRRVRLLSGDAYFTVAPVAGAEHRPFIVAAAGGTAQALGTQFMVAREPDGGLVTVAEHKVRVTAAASGGPAATVTLLPGEAVRYDGGHGLQSAHDVDVTEATSWREGRLVFNDQPLAQVIARLNRYRRGRIVIADHRLAALKVNGVFMTDDLSGALAAITQELGARTIAMPFVTVLY
jgi:transmembrane sensor